MKRLEFEQFANVLPSFEPFSIRRKLEVLETPSLVQEVIIQLPQPRSPYSSPDKRNSFSKILNRLESKYQQELLEHPLERPMPIREPLSDLGNAVAGQLSEVCLSIIYK